MPSVYYGKENIVFCLIWICYIRILFTEQHIDMVLLHVFNSHKHSLKGREEMVSVNQ